MKQRYKLCKSFLEGVLKDLTIEEQTTVRFENGGTYGGGWSGSRHKVTGIDAEPEPDTSPSPQAIIATVGEPNAGSLIFCP